MYGFCTCRCGPPWIEITREDLCWPCTLFLAIIPEQDRVAASWHSLSSILPCTISHPKVMEDMWEPGHTGSNTTACHVMKETTASSDFISGYSQRSRIYGYQEQLCLHRIFSISSVGKRFFLIVNIFIDIFVCVCMHVYNTIWSESHISSPLSYPPLWNPSFLTTPPAFCFFSFLMTGWV